MRRAYPCTHPDNESFYSWDRLLSHGADVSVSLSIRDLGKSYGAVQTTIKKALAQGFNCAILRWDLGEVKKMADDVFDWSEIHGKDNPEGVYFKTAVADHVFYYEHAVTRARLYFLSVKASNKNKGLDIKNLKWVFYDEFIPEIYDTQTRRLQEFDRFTSMYLTLVRDNRNMRVMLAANCITWFHGYFEAWNIRPFASGMIIKQKFEVEVDGIRRSFSIAVENVKPTRAMMERILKNEAVRGKRFTREYFENITGDNMGFIATCPRSDVPLFSAQWVFMGRYYSFRYHDGLYYWMETSKRDVDTYTTSKSDVGPRVIRDRQMGRTFDQLYDSGRFRFEDGHVEQTVLSMIWAGRQNQL